MCRCFLYLLLLCHAVFSQIIEIDLAPDLSGIQKEYTAADTGNVFSLELYGTGFTDIYSYQCKVRFDTAQFTFLGGEADQGLVGTQNILEAQGGTIIGICQTQTNPEDPSVIDLAWSITTENVNLSVTGEGLMGVLLFKNKLSRGETGIFEVFNRYWSELGGAAVPITASDSAWYSVALDLCTLTVSSDSSGSTNPDGDTVVSVGSVIDILAEPAVGYKFLHWDVDSGSAVFEDSLSAATTITVNGSVVSVSAHFEAHIYTISFEESEGGSTLPSNDIDAAFGDTIAIKALADEGFDFIKWGIISGNVLLIDSTSAETAVVISSSDVVLKPVFDRRVSSHLPELKDLPTAFEIRGLRRGAVLQQGIRIGIPALNNQATTASLKLYNFQGRLVRELFNGSLTPGYHTFFIDRERALAGGSYLCIFHCGNVNETILLTESR